MKAITIWQPWASLIVAGAKPYEFRGWTPPKALINHRIAIHAGVRKPKKAEIIALLHGLRGHIGFTNPCLHKEQAIELLERAREQMHLLPLGAIVGTATLGKPKRGDLCAQEMGLGAAGNDSDRPGTFNWGWPMLDVKPLLPPVECRGAQGFWNVNTSLLEGAHV